MWDPLHFLVFLSDLHSQVTDLIIMHAAEVPAMNDQPENVLFIPVNRLKQVAALENARVLFYFSYFLVWPF